MDGVLVFWFRNLSSGFRRQRRSPSGAAGGRGDGGGEGAEGWGLQDGDVTTRYRGVALAHQNESGYLLGGLHGRRGVAAWLIFASVLFLYASGTGGWSCSFPCAQFTRGSSYAMVVSRWWLSLNG